MSEYAVAVAISNNYTFAFANLLIGLKKHSANLMEETDVLCYQEDLTEKNKKLLQTIHTKLIFKDLSELNCLPSEIFEDKLVTKSRWGKYVLIKLLGFELIKRYRKVLFLDVDMLVQKDIAPIMDMKNLSWRKIASWSADDVFKNILFTKEKMVGCSGGVVLFSEEINLFPVITRQDLLHAYLKTKDCRGGVEEKILTFIAYWKGIPVSEMPMEYHCNLMSKVKDRAIIVHYNDDIANCKPWQNGMVAVVIPEWYENYKKYLLLGGDSVLPVGSYFDVHNRYVFVRNTPRLLELFRFLLTSGYSIKECNYQYDPCYIKFRMSDLDEFCSFSLRLYAKKYRFQFEVEDSVLSQTPYINELLKGIKQKLSTINQASLTHDQKKIVLFVDFPSSSYQNPLRTTLDIILSEFSSRLVKSDDGPYCRFLNLKKIISSFKYKD